jgi:hypothetical protein
MISDKPLAAVEQRCSVGEMIEESVDEIGVAGNQYIVNQGNKIFDD